MELKKLISKLSEFIAMDSENNHEQIAGFIVGELIGDYDDKYGKLRKEYPEVERIAELASDLEWSNGSGDDLGAMWTELISLVEDLNKRNP